MAEINNLDKLTDKIYQEGIEKAEQESKRLLTNAEAERIFVLENASNQAKKIIADATSEARRISRSMEKEVQLKGKQLVSDLKGEIQNLLSLKVLKEPTREAFGDNNFIQEAILEAIASWKPTDDLELMLPGDLESKLEQAFKQLVKAHSKNLNITFNNQLKGGFQILEKVNSYKISFTEEDFIALFSPYLEEQTSKTLFKQSI